MNVAKAKKKEEVNLGIKAQKKLTLYQIREYSQKLFFLTFLLPVIIGTVRILTTKKIIDDIIKTLSIFINKTPH